VDFLGNVVGEGKLGVQEAKIKAILGISDQEEADVVSGVYRLLPQIYTQLLYCAE
jgi:hypothetical protein